MVPILVLTRTNLRTDGSHSRELGPLVKRSFINVHPIYVLRASLHFDPLARWKFAVD